MTKKSLALITGAANGLGLETARGLLQQGVDVVLSDVDVAAGHAALAKLAGQFPDAQLSFVELDLADLESIARFADGFQAEHTALDILINNAGVFPPFQRATTTQGAELAFGIGFYGHFALTAQLLPLLIAATAARVVTVSSVSHATGWVDLADPMQERDYDGNKAYGASKLACLVFAYELDRCARANGAALISVAAHPGIARTKIGQHADNPPTTLRQRAVGAAKNLAMQWLGQDVDQGALPMIYAATESDVRGGTFIGPSGFGQFKGMPTEVTANAKALARCDAQRLWDMAEQFTGQHFNWNQNSKDSR